MIVTIIFLKRKLLTGTAASSSCHQSPEDAQSSERPGFTRLGRQMYYLVVIDKKKKKKNRELKVKNVRGALEKYGWTPGTKENLFISRILVM